MNTAENCDKQKLEFTHKYTQLITLIETSKTIKDLIPILYKLLPLSELKELLLKKLTLLNVSSTAHIEPLHELYYHCIPLDEIFSDDVLCHIIQFVSSSSDDDADYMYNKLPIINHHFNKLMKEKTILYQQYKICVSLNDDLWKKRKSVLIQISHQSKSIYILDPVGTASGAITPPRRFGKKYNIKFEILNLDDMNNKCPFIWWSIKKWHIISSSINANRLYSHNIYQYYNKKKEDRVNRIYYSNDFSGYVSPTDSLDLTPTFNKSTNRRTSFFNESNDNKQKVISRMDILTENNSIMKQLLDKAAVHIKSIQIEHNDHRTKHALKNFFWLNKLFHIRSLSHDMISFYSITNLCYLDLIHTIHSKTFEILRELKQLLVIKLDLNVRYIKNEENDDEKQWLVTFPINVEFIQIKNFSNSSQYVLNMNECKNIIAMLFCESKIFEWDITDYYTKQKSANNVYRQIAKCMIWPNKAYPIECILFDDGIETRSIDNWYRYFEKHRVSKNIIPIRYCRYRIMPTIFTHRIIPNSPISFNEEFLECDLHSNDSNAATVDDNFSLDKSITIKDCNHLGEEEEKLYLPLTPPSTNKKLHKRELSWTQSSYNYTDSGTTTGNGNNTSTALWVHSASLDEEEEMKGTLPLTKDILDRYASINNQLFVQNDMMEENDITNIEAKIVKITEIKINQISEEEFCMILDNKQNDGLLWKLLLSNKYYSNDKFIQERILMYKQWFNMDIAKWIYHLGYWMENDPLFINIHHKKQRLSINVNNISTTHSQPNVPRRSATINTSSPTVSSSPSVVDSLELYLPTNTQQ